MLVHYLLLGLFGGAASAPAARRRHGLSLGIGLGVSHRGGQSSGGGGVPDPGDDQLLIEGGDALLSEAGDALLLEG